MKEIIIFLIIIIGLWIAYRVIKHKLKNKVDTITAYTGGLGSGKTFLSVDTALKLYRKNLSKWKWHRFKHKFKNYFKKEKTTFLEDEPKLFSNIPVCIGHSGHFKNKKYYYSSELTKEHLLLQERLPLGSVVLLDEIGAFANQFDFKEENVIKVFDEFVRLFRHYVSNPKLNIQSYMVVNDQCSENINLVIRRRLNIVNNLSNFKLLFKIFAFYYERQIIISEEIKTIDMKQDETQADTQDNSNFKFMFYFGGKRYDTYCYHNRYNRVPKKYFKKYSCLSKDDLLKCPRDKERKFSQLTERKEEN